jgi:hypothetical protein
VNAQQRDKQHDTQRICGVFLTTLFLMEEGEAGLVSNSPAPGDAQE